MASDGSVEDVVLDASCGISLLEETPSHKVASSRQVRRYSASEIRLRTAGVVFQPYLDNSAAEVVIFPDDDDGHYIPYTKRFTGDAFWLFRVLCTRSHGNTLRRATFDIVRTAYLANQS